MYLDPSLGSTIFPQKKKLSIFLCKKRATKLRIIRTINPKQNKSHFRHAEDLFGELARDAQQLYDRSNSLQARIDRLAIKVTQLDSTVEEVSLQDIHMRKAFKSAVVFDQQVRSIFKPFVIQTKNI